MMAVQRISDIIISNPPELGQADLFTISDFDPNPENRFVIVYFDESFSSPSDENANETPEDLYLQRMCEKIQEALERAHDQLFRIDCCRAMQGSRIMARIVVHGDSVTVVQVN